MFPVELDIRHLPISTAFVGLDDEGNRVVGLGWYRSHCSERMVEIQVLPTHRRRGVGQALLERLAPPDQPVLVAADAGHPRARRFLVHRRFQQIGAVFHLRWDGELTDVPPAFRTAQITDEADPEIALSVLQQATSGVWPPLLLCADDLGQPGYCARAAWLDETRIGMLVAHQSDDDLCVDGVAVFPEHRGRGVGRALVCDLMGLAARQGFGVTLKVAQQDHATLGWCNKLGLWTFRTWAYFRREPL